MTAGANPMPHILLVGCDDVFQSEFPEVLREAGHEVTSADDSYQALTVIVRRRPDTIVADRRTTYPDGLSLLKMLRTQGVVIPAILVSSSPISAPHPADVVLVKPFDNKALLSTIDRVLRR